MTSRHLIPTALAAQALGVAPKTIHDWRYRGLVEPRGGTPRRPLWDLADLRRAQQAPKPRRTTARRVDAAQDRDRQSSQAEPCPPPQ